MSGSLETTFHPLAEDPYLFYARARKEEPITFCPERNAWMVTRYKDIQHILLQPGLFSSRETQPSSLTFCERACEELARGYAPVPVVHNTDDPEHARFRAPLTKAFAPARVRALEPFVRGVANTLIDAFFHDGHADIIRQFAYPLALEVVFSLLGIPRQDIEQARQWSQDWLLMMAIPLEEERQVACARSVVTFQHYLAGLIAERVKTPQDDLLSLLVHSSLMDEHPFTEGELVHMLQGLILAGHESSTNMIGTGVQLLLEHPASWQRLCERPDAIPAAVEEILRFDSPIQMFARTATCEVSIGGVTLPEGAALLLIYGSGNRDEEVFANAHEFQPQRAPNHHLAFGYGMHYCVGAALARLEGRVAFEVLCQRLPHLRLAPGQTLVHVPAQLFRGYEQLDVVFDPVACSRDAHRSAKMPAQIIK